MGKTLEIKREDIEALLCDDNVCQAITLFILKRWGQNGLNVDTVTELLNDILKELGNHYEGKNKA